MARGKVGLGRRGETLAVRALRRHGYAVIERNWYCPHGEVDLVARRNHELYFIEVRTRRTTGGPSPEESLTSRKLARMETVARTYLGTHAHSDIVSWHLAFVAVALDRAGRLHRITLYPDLDGEPEDLLRNP
ncbi:MAG: YraN family protein [Anaerolineae bacterium]